jgi:conjugative transfer signal peptidase TraF
MVSQVSQKYRSRNAQLFPRLGWLLSGLAASFTVAWAAGVRVNLTESIPLGVYRESGDASELERGDVVLVCLPQSTAQLAHSRGYVPGGGRCVGGLAPVGKLVMALPGDTVSVAPTGLSVNGSPVRHSSALDHDSEGRPLPRTPAGRWIVQSRTLWLVGTSSRSFDSRYFGPVPQDDVLSRIRLIHRI